MPADREDDAPYDDAIVNSRETGGVEGPEKDDQAVTTGTTPKGDFVGRIAGDDLGYAGETGAERRANPEG